MIPTAGIRDVYKIGIYFAIYILIRDALQLRLSAMGVYCSAALGIWLYYAVRFPHVAYWYYVPLYLCTALAIGLVFEEAGISFAGTRKSFVMQSLAVVALSAMLCYRGYLMHQYSVRGEGERTLLYDAALQLNALAKSPERAAAWNSGILAYFCNVPVTNLDGLVNSHEYYEEYLLKRRTYEYLDEQKFDWIVDAPIYFNGPDSAKIRQQYLMRDYRGLRILGRIPEQANRLSEVELP
jgi:hypothetical protein